MLIAMRHSDLPDPRSFVKSAPLPLPPHTGIKIQARNLNVYNASMPLRDDIRKDNYVRRREQMNSMGFQTPMNLPYRVIGDPLYLEQKQIILYGLGQLTDLNASKVDDTEQLLINQNTARESSEKSEKIQSFNFRSLKDSKDLFNLQTEVKKTKELVRKVKLGTSLFDLLQKAEEEKLKQLRKKNKISNEMLIRPMRDSDDDLEQDTSEDELAFTDSNRYFENSFNQNSLLAQNNNNNESNSDSKELEKSPLPLRIPKLKILDDNNESSSKLNPNERVQSLAAQNYSMINSASTGLSLRRPKTSNKKLKDSLKPYTPAYSSILVREESFMMDKESITRQLCVLLWLLESLSVEPPNSIGHLRTCFLVKELGGEKISEKAAQKIKEKETRWNNFKKISNEAKKDKNSNKQLPLRMDKTRKKTKISLSIANASELLDETINNNAISNNQNEDESDSNKDILSDSMRDVLNPLQSQPANQTNQQALNQSNIETNRESLNVSNLDMITSRDTLVNDNFNNFPNGTVLGASNIHVQSTVSVLNAKNSKPKATNVKNENKKTAQGSNSLKNLNSLKSKKSGEFKITEHELELLKIGDENEMDRIFNKPGMKHERRNSKSLKAITGPITALLTKEVIEYQKSLPSVKKSVKLVEMKNDFDNIVDEKTIEIHKRLELVIKKRINNCMVKFSSMNLNERGLHKMIRAMNKSVLEYQKIEDLKNTPEPKYYQWYIDIENLIDTNYNKEDVILGKLLDKLSNYGKLNTKKQNEALFFKILDNLSIFEILSPDVMSAIEFCRERILEIHEDDFENWFKSKTQKYPELFFSRKSS